MTGSIASAFQPPSTASRYRDAAQITRLVKPRDPLYLFCPAQLEGRASEFRSGFPGTVSYAVKANPEARVLQTLRASGIDHFDVASLGEIEWVRDCCPDATLHFNNPVKPEDAVREAYLRHGVRSFALDEPAELEKIWRCSAADRSVTYSVRFKLGHAGAAYDFGSKFGTDTDGAVALLREVQRRGAIPALTFHPGSQCTDAAMFARYIEAAAGICQRAGVDISLLNVGGGFALPYRNADTPPLSSYFTHIRNSFKLAFPAGPALLCEPGRAMVATSTSLLTRVTHVRGDGRSLFINDGVYGGLQEQSVVDLEHPARVWRQGVLLQAPPVEYRVFGPTCDPVDRLARGVILPAGIRSDDYIEFGSLGAYGSATATGFNGFSSTCYVDVERGWPGAAG